MLNNLFQQNNHGNNNGGEIEDENEPLNQDEKLAEYIGEQVKKDEIITLKLIRILKESEHGTIKKVRVIFKNYVNHKIELIINIFAASLKIYKESTSYLEEKTSEALKPFEKKIIFQNLFDDKGSFFMGYGLKKKVLIMSKSREEYLRA